MPDDDSKTYNFNIKVEGLRSDDSVRDEMMFENVPIECGYKTTYRGTYYVTTAQEGSFVVEDWNSFDTVNF